MSTDRDDQEVIFIVDDDAAVRESLCYLLGKAGFETRSFSSVHEFCLEYDPKCIGCCIFDLRIGEESGIELAHYLNRIESKHPFIFLTGFGTVSSAVEAMKQGALNYLEKPVDPSQLLSCVKDAIERHRKSMDKQLRFIHSPIIDQVLSERERQVMNLVLEGLLAKQIASRLGISTKTVEVHKSNMKRKLGVKSTVELIRLMK